MPPADQRALAQTFGVSDGPEMLANLYQLLIDPEQYQARMEKLGEPSRRFLGEVLLHGGVIAWEQAFNYPQFKSILKELLRHHLIYGMEDRHYGRYFALPNEYASFAWSLCVVAFLDRPLATDESSPRREQIGSVWCPFMQDLYQMLSFARVEPIPLTQQGFIYKRTETKIGQKVWPKASAETVSERLNMLINFARQNLLVVYDYSRRSLVVVDEECTTFFDLDPLQHFQTWFTFAWREGGGSYLRQALMAMAAFLLPQQWLDLHAFSAWLAAHGIPDLNSSYAWDRLLRPLIAAGIWEGDSKRGRLSDYAYLAVTGTMAPEEQNQALIQPTGEVLVPPETPMAERWQWDSMCTLVTVDRMSVYKIDQAGLERALDLELDLNDRIALMQTLSKAPMPSNVRTNLEDWKRALTRHRVIEATIVHSDSASASQDVEHRLGKRVIYRLSDTDLVIRPDSAPDAIRLLNKAGIPVRSRVERPGVATNPSDEYSEMPALWQTFDQDIYTDAHYPISASVPSPSLSIPDYPKMREMLNAAIQGKRSVYITYRVPVERREVTKHVVPYQFRNEWLQGAVVGSHQIANIQFDLIQAVQLERPS
jgi:hypothetical protein